MGTQVHVCISDLSGSIVLDGSIVGATTCWTLKQKIASEKGWSSYDLALVPEGQVEILKDHQALADLVNLSEPTEAVSLTVIRQQPTSRTSRVWNAQRRLWEWKLVS